MDQRTEWQDQLMATVSSQVEKFGFSISYVGGECMVPGCDGDHPSDAGSLDLPRYGYTVGLPAGFEHPELVVVGLSSVTTSELLNLLGAAVQNGARFEEGEAFSTGELQVTFGACSPTLVLDGLIAVSFAYHETKHRGMPSPLQVLWPDLDGRYPHDTRASEELRRMQPLLSDR